MHDNFNKKIYIFFLLELSYKNSCIKLDYFQGEIVNFFPQKQDAEKRKSQLNGRLYGIMTLWLCASDVIQLIPNPCKINLDE